MKKIFYFLASAIVALGAMACQNEVDENINPNETKEISFKVSFDESTRIAMGELTGGKLPFEFDGKGLNDGPDSLYVGYSRFNGESYDTKRAFLVNSEENPYEFVADAENQAILQELVGEENIHVVNRNNETVVSADGENGLLFKSEEFDLVAGENEVKLSLACPAFYFTVPEGTEVVFSAKRGDNSVLTEIYHPIPEATLVSRVESLTFGEGTHIVGVNKSYNPEVTIAYSVNGVTVKEASLTLTNKVYNLGTLGYEFTTINTKEQLIAFAEHVNAGNNYKDKTVKLGQSINLEGEILAPIGNSKANAFRGNFDGQGNTISNFTVEHAEVAGLFGMLAGGSIKNLNVNKATIYGNSYAGGIVAWVQATSYQGWQGAADAVVDNCNVTYTEITSTVINNDNAAKVGGIAGYVVYGTISNSTVADTNITAYRDMGGIAGMANFASSNGKGAVISGNTVGENVTITVDNSTNYNNYTTADQYNVASIVGRIATGAIVENNTGEATIVLPKTAVEELNEQIANSEGNTTITLTEDIVAGENEMITIPAGKTITLNLNGKTISQEKECTASHQLIKNNGTLTITGNGKISFKDTSAGDSTFGWGSYTIHNSGNLTVENGTIEHIGEQAFATHMICAIFQYSGTTTINGGVISTPNYRSVRLWKGNMTINGGEFDGQLWVQAVDNTANLVITDGTFGPNGGDGSSVFVENKTYTVDVEITGGTFTTKLGASNAVKGWVKGGQFGVDPTAYVADGYKAIENEGVWTVKTWNPVASVEGVEYEKLADALTAAGTTKVVTLLADATVSQQCIIKENGKKLTITGNFAKTSKKGDGNAYVYPTTEWRLVGNIANFGNWAYGSSKAVMLKEHETVVVIRNVTLAANNEFKFCKDGTWANGSHIGAYGTGGAGNISYNSWYGVDKRWGEFTANIKNTTAGTYDIFFATDNGNWYVAKSSDHKEVGSF